MPKRSTPSNTKTVSYRLPTKVAQQVEGYAQAHGLTNTQACLHFLRLGIQAEYGTRPATKADLEALRLQIRAGFQSTARAISEQPISVQLPEPKDEVASRADDNAVNHDEGTSPERQGESHGLVSRIFARFKFGS